jgi:hypothetical protein
MAEKQLIEAQTKLLERTRKAAEVHRQLAAECHQAGLPILAREHHYVAKCLDDKISLQLRAFRDEALAEPESEAGLKPCWPAREQGQGEVE